MIGEVEGFDGVGSTEPAGYPIGLKEAIQGELVAAGKGEDQIVLLSLESEKISGLEIEEMNLIETVVETEIGDCVMAKAASKEIGVRAAAAIEKVIA